MTLTVGAAPQWCSLQASALVLSLQSVASSNLLGGREGVCHSPQKMRDWVVCSEWSAQSGSGWSDLLHVFRSEQF